MDNRNLIRNRFTLEMRIIPQKVVISTVHEQFLKRAMEIVENNLTDTDFNIRHFSQKIGVSRAQLFRKIKATTTLTPSEFIHIMRLKKATQLLEQSDLSITEICYEVGFNYPSHFAKLFHEHYGIRPREYRFTHQNVGI